LILSELIVFYTLIKHGPKIMMNTLELLNGVPSEPSILTSTDFIQARNRKTDTPELQFPKYCILGFFPALVQHCRRNYSAVSFDPVHRGHPYLIFVHRGLSMAFIHPGMGSPVASAVLDETFALGAETCIFIGSAGALVEDFRRGEVMLPVRAVRDEGTSFHYDAPARHAFPDPGLTDAVRSTLAVKKILFREGTTWTTDGVYREIPSKIRRLREEGCLAVDMEASALFSVARHYRGHIAGIFLIWDSISGAAWRQLPPASGGRQMTPAGLLEAAMDSLHCFHSIRKA
jgi:uridine phosphorylase